MLYTYAVRFDVTENLENFLVFGGNYKQGFNQIMQGMMHLEFGCIWGASQMLTCFLSLPLAAGFSSSSRGCSCFALYRQQHMGGSGLAVVGPVVDVHGVPDALRLLSSLSALLRSMIRPLPPFPSDKNLVQTTKMQHAMAARSPKVGEWFMWAHVTT